MVASLLAAAALAPLSSSKLSIHLLGGRYTPGARQVVEAGPRVLKVFDLHKDMLDAMRDYKRSHPQGKIILRIWHTRKWTLEDDPSASAGQYWSEVLEPALARLKPADRKRIDYVEGPNEGDSTPTWFSLDQAKWYSAFTSELCALIQKGGHRPLIGNIGVGQPGGSPEEMEAKWRAYYPALESSKKAGGAWSYHSYTIHYSMNLELESWYSLRYRRLLDLMRKDRPDLVDIPIILSEGGVDYGGNGAKDGWMQRGTQRRFREWLRWFDGELQKDPQVMGVTLFQSGDPGLWPSFELEPILPWLAGFLRESR